MYDPLIHLHTKPGDRWLFRWVFEFSDGRMPRIGGWFPASRFEDSASAVNKKNLLWAYIEGKHWTTREQKRFGDCPGPDFVNFQHLAAQMVIGGISKNHVYGMRIIARDYIITALEDGTTSYERRTHDDDYPEWTRF